MPLQGNLNIGAGHRFCGTAYPKRPSPAPSGYQGRAPPRQGVGRLYYNPQGQLVRKVEDEEVLETSNGVPGQSPEAAGWDQEYDPWVEGDRG